MSRHRWNQFADVKGRSRRLRFLACRIWNAEMTVPVPASSAMQQMLPQISPRAISPQALPNRPGAL
jgi:uncharacterized membrane protein YhaH (DUF805 family)